MSIEMVKRQICPFDHLLRFKLIDVGLIGR